MSEKKKKGTWGGAREGSGRKPRTEEQKVLEKLSPMEEDAIKALHTAIKGGESWAVIRWMDYVYGKPKERKELDVEGGLSLTVQFVD